MLGRWWRCTRGARPAARRVASRPRAPRASPSSTRGRRAGRAPSAAPARSRAPSSLGGGALRGRARHRRATTPLAAHACVGEHDSSPAQRTAGEELKKTQKESRGDEGVRLSRRRAVEMRASAEGGLAEKRKTAHGGRRMQSGCMGSNGIGTHARSQPDVRASRMHSGCIGSGRTDAWDARGCMGSGCMGSGCMHAWALAARREGLWRQRLAHRRIAGARWKARAASSMSGRDMTKNECQPTTDWAPAPPTSIRISLAELSADTLARRVGEMAHRAARSAAATAATRAVPCSPIRRAKHRRVQSRKMKGPWPPCNSEPRKPRADCAETERSSPWPFVSWDSRAAPAPAGRCPPASSQSSKRR